MSTDTVTVALRHPHGIICRIHHLVDVPEPLPGGGTKNVKQWQPTGQSFKLNGYSKPAVGEEPPPPATAGGFVLTHGVPKDLWEEWLRQNKDLDLVVRGLVFAHTTTASANAESREKENLRSGLEPIDRSRLPKGIGSVKAA